MYKRVDKIMNSNRNRASKPNYDLLINVSSFFLASLRSRDVIVRAFSLRASENLIQFSSPCHPRTNCFITLIIHTDTRIRRHQHRHSFRLVDHYNVLHRSGGKRRHHIRRTDRLRYVYERSSNVDFEICYQRGK